MNKVARLRAWAADRIDQLIVRLDDGSAHMPTKGRQWPHCDTGVLHAPGECPTCDHFAPDLQQVRQEWGINFTGHYEQGLYLCPAEKARPLSMIHSWGGNSPDESGAGFYGLSKEAFAQALAALSGADSPVIPTAAEIAHATAVLQAIADDPTGTKESS